MSKLTESLFSNKELRRELEEIDESCPNEISHGYQHAINVIENIKKLAKLLEIDERTTDYLIIAGYLHDLGQKEGKKDHTIRSSKRAEKYLPKEMDKKWKQKILSSILHHHEHQNIKELSLFEHILLFADKLDVTKVRQNKKYTSKNNQDNYIETIEEVNFKIEGKNFIVEIIKNKEKNLKEWDYFKKTEERVIEFANKINKTGKIIEKVE